jgi:uncharacterized membrane protein
MIGTDGEGMWAPHAGRRSGPRGLIVLAYLYAVGLGLWIVVNAGLVPQVRPFDPYPFHLLTLITSAEAVLLCLFVLTRLGRMEARAVERHRLALRAGLLIEEELVEMARLAKSIEARLGAEHGVRKERPGGDAEDWRPKPEH